MVHSSRRPCFFKHTPKPPPECLRVLLPLKTKHVAPHHDRQPLAEIAGQVVVAAPQDRPDVVGKLIHLDSMFTICSICSSSRTERDSIPRGVSPPQRFFTACRGFENGRSSACHSDCGGYAGRRYSGGADDLRRRRDHGASHHADRQCVSRGADRRVEGAGFRGYARGRTRTRKENTERH